MKLPGVFLEENSGESLCSFVCASVCLSVVSVRDERARFSCSKAMVVVGRVTGFWSRRKKGELFDSARFTRQVFFFSAEMASRAKLLVRSGGGWRFMKWTPRLFM